MVKEAQELTGKLGHLAEGANWVFPLLTHLCIHCICPFLEQEIPGRFFPRVSNPHQVTTLWLLLLQCQGPNLPHLICHQTVCIIGTSIQVSIQHHQINAPGDRVLLQQVTS
jgi:hypothetical protein